VDYIKDIYTYKIVNMHEIRANVFRLPGEEIRPAIIWIHGGALIFGSRNSLPTDQLERYLNAGYTVVSIDYRLAPETKLPHIIADLKDAYRWVCGDGADMFMIDPDRIGIVGHSAGGYLSLTAGFMLKPRPKVLVSFYGYGELASPWYSQPDPFYNELPGISKEHALGKVGVSMISTTQTPFPPDGRYQFYLYCRQNGLWPKEVGGHDPETESAWFSDYEPIHNISSAYPPTMLLHGEKDTDVPFNQSVLMAKALSRHGTENKFIPNHDWGHGFDKVQMDDRSVHDAFKQVLLFLKRHLGDTG
jgi:acetyl esterase/lipase